MNLPNYPVEKIEPIPFCKFVYVFVNNKWYKTIDILATAHQPHWGEITDQREISLIEQTQMTQAEIEMSLDKYIASDTRKRIENAWQELNELNKKYFYFFTE